MLMPRCALAAEEHVWWFDIEVANAVPVLDFELFLERVSNSEVGHRESGAHMFQDVPAKPL